VAAFLWQAAHKVFDIPASHKDLLAWSCHSIHVMVTNLLHHARFLDSYIKNHLRWCSDTFLMYLHNTFYTADQHTNAITLSLNPLLSRTKPYSAHAPPNSSHHRAAHFPFHIAVAVQHRHNTTHY
jgi:hypothetical protein